MRIFTKSSFVETVKLDHNRETPLQFGYEVADAAYMKGTACYKQNIIRFMLPYLVLTVHPSTIGRISL